MTTTATVTSSPITATVSGAAVSATVTSSSVSASAAGGVGPQGPAGGAGSGGATTDASLLTSGTLSAARLPASVVLTSDSRLSDARTPTTHSHAVADVTGLQTALDSKQASGSYAAASHTHTLSQISQSSATSGQVPTWNGTAWAPAAPAGGVTDGSKGDIVVSDSGATWTIAAGAVTEADLANAVRNSIIHPFLLMGG